MTGHRHRTWWRLLAALAALALVAAACGDDGDDGADSGTTSTADAGDDGTESTAPPDDGPVYGGTIVVGLEAESNGWLPGTSNWATSGYTVAGTIYDALLAFDADGITQPYLAESIEPNDDLSAWTLTLRPGITFHDGSALTADVVAWNIETLHFVEGSNTIGSLLSAGFTGTTVVDELTLVYELSGPNAAFPDLLRNAIGMPISQQAYEDLGPEDFSANPVGTGPFVFDRWTMDDRFVVTRNPDYWRTDDDGNPLPYLDQIDFRPIPDEDSRVQSLASGDLQVMQTLRGTNVKQVQNLEAGGGFGTSFYVGNAAGVSIINVLEPPLDDVRLRRAMGYAGDSDAVAVVLGDDGLVPNTTQFFSVDSPWYSERVAEAYPGYPERDLETARALVEEYKNDPNRSDGRAVGDPVTFQYNCPPDPSLIEVAQLVQALWGEAGMEVTLAQVEQAAHIQNAIGSPDSDPPFRGNYQVNCWRSGGQDDPSIIFGSEFGPVESSPLNFTNFFDPRIAELVELLQTTDDVDERYAAVEEIGLIVVDQMPMTWGVGTASIVGFADTVQGIADWTLPSGDPGQGTPGARIWFHQTWVTG
jgi:peptide/nickel transport system substrate-binding protein